MQIKFMHCGILINFHITLFENFILFMLSRRDLAINIQPQISLSTVVWCINWVSVKHIHKQSNANDLDCKLKFYFYFYLYFYNFLTSLKVSQFCSSISFADFFFHIMKVACILHANLCTLSSIHFIYFLVKAIS